MPLIQDIKQINPLDTRKISIGVAFPLNETNMTSGTQTVKEQLKTNFLNYKLVESILFVLLIFHEIFLNNHILQLGKRL